MFYVFNNVLKDNGPVHVENFIKCLHVTHRRTVSVKARVAHKVLVLGFLTTCLLEIKDEMRLELFKTKL